MEATAEGVRPADSRANQPPRSPERATEATLAAFQLRLQNDHWDIHRQYHPATPEHQPTAVGFGRFTPEAMAGMEESSLQERREIHAGKTAREQWDEYNQNMFTWFGDLNRTVTAESERNLYAQFGIDLSQFTDRDSSNAQSRTLFNKYFAHDDEVLREHRKSGIDDFTTDALRIWNRMTIEEQQEQQAAFTRVVGKISAIFGKDLGQSLEKTFTPNGQGTENYISTADQQINVLGPTPPTLEGQLLGRMLKRRGDIYVYKQNYRPAQPASPGTGTGNPPSRAGETTPASQTEPSGTNPAAASPVAEEKEEQELERIPHLSPAAREIFASAYRQLAFSSSRSPRTQEQQGQQFVADIATYVDRRFGTVETAANTRQALYAGILAQIKTAIPDEHDPKRQTAEQLLANLRTSTEQAVAGGRIDDLTARVFLHEVTDLKDIGGMAYYNLLLNPHSDTTRLAAHSASFSQELDAMKAEFRAKPGVKIDDTTQVDYTHFNANIYPVKNRVYINANLEHAPEKVIQAWMQALEETGMQDKVYFKVMNGLANRYENIIVYLGDGQPPSADLERLFDAFIKKCPQDSLSEKPMPTALPLHKGITYSPEPANINAMLKMVGKEGASYNKLIASLLHLSFERAYYDLQQQGTKPGFPKEIRDSAAQYFTEFLVLSGINPDTMVPYSQGGRLVPWAEALRTKTPQAEKPLDPNLQPFIDLVKENRVRDEQFYRSAMDAAIQRLEAVPQAERAIVRLSADIPTVIIPDLHARPEMLLAVLSQPSGQQTADGKDISIYELLRQGKMQVVCLGDAMHSEKKERWDIDHRIKYEVDERGLIKYQNGQPVESAAWKKFDTVYQALKYNKVAAVLQPAGVPDNVTRAYIRLRENPSSPDQADQLVVSEYNRTHQVGGINQLDELWSTSIGRIETEIESDPDYIRADKELDPLRQQAENDMMEQEMAQDMTLMYMIWKLQANNPAFHFILGNHDDIGLKTGPYEKYGGESVKTMLWLMKHFGRDFYDHWVSSYQANLPLTGQGGRMLVSHTTPKNPHTRQEIARAQIDLFSADPAARQRGKSVVLDFIFPRETTRAVVEQTRDEFGLPANQDVYWFVAHTPTGSEKYKEQTYGKVRVITTDNDENFVYTIYDPRQAFAPASAVHLLPSAGYLFPVNPIK